MAAIRVTISCSSRSKIGPVTAPNRFYQTPHATGMGWRAPKASAALRGVKAEGGWGVVCTEYCSIHPSSDDFPYALSVAVGRGRCAGAGHDRRGHPRAWSARRRSSSGMAASTPTTG